jgi:hypothetical protein
MCSYCARSNLFKKILDNTDTHLKNNLIVKNLRRDFLFFLNSEKEVAKESSLVLSLVWSK